MHHNVDKVGADQDLFEEKVVSKALKMIAFTTLLMAHSGLHAQDKKDVRSLKTCRTITNDATRLSCYDNLTDNIVQDIAPTQSGRPYDPVKDFGASSAMLAKEEVGDQEAPFIEAKITSARLFGYDQWIITLETGAVWKQVDNTMLVADPKPGATIKIRQAMLGSYIANVGKGKGFKVERIR